MVKKNKKKNKLGLKGQILLSMVIITATIFMASAVFLLIAMIPTFVALIADNSKERLKSYTIGFLNFAGAFPFLLDLITTNHTIDYALIIASDPLTISIIYAAAAVGYLINWAIVGITANIMVQKGQKRLNHIDDRIAALKERWGEEVTGEIRLDAEGFPIEADALRAPDKN
jgi:hypothetical protein|tara:strand:+ start:461 stop:976 length:516 start_codon:yes stop_codon:yes gene_type:complete